MKFQIDSYWFRFLEELPPAEIVKVVHAIWQYAEGQEVDMPDTAIWATVKQGIDEELRAKQELIEKKRAAAYARWHKETPTEEGQGDWVAIPMPAEPQNRFASLTDDPEILSALADPASGLSVFLDTGQGYDDSLTRKECEFADRGDVRALCTWHKEIVAATKAVKKKRPTEPPTLDEWLDFCAEKKLDPDRMRSVYESYAVAHWHDSHGNPILNWRAKILQVWAIDPKNQWRPKANLQKKGRIDEMREASEMAKELLKQRGIKL